MSFKRNFPKNLQDALRKESLYKKKLLPDLQKGEVFMAIRNNYVDFYHKGGLLFGYDSKGFKTNIKYAAVIPKVKNDYLYSKDLKNSKLITDFVSEYKRIKENCKRYSNVEQIGVSILCKEYSYLKPNNDIVVLDIEVSLKALTVKRSQDRIDILFYNTTNKTLYFVEAKHYSNPEIKASKNRIPDVVYQVTRYKKQISTKSSQILSEYIKYVDLINSFFSLRIPEPKIIHPDVKLLIFGYDDSQRKKVKNIADRLINLGISTYTIGNTSSLNIPNIIH